MDHYKLFINGEFISSQTGNSFLVEDPGLGHPIAEVSKAGVEDALDAVGAARKAFDSGIWSRLSREQRAEKMVLFADEVARESLRLMAIESKNSGQIIKLAAIAPFLSANYIRHVSKYSLNQFRWEEEVYQTNGVFGREFICREPVGVCVAIIPWNFPLISAVWKIAAALCMGNSIILKPASATPLSALILAEAAKRSGIPHGVLNILSGEGEELGQALCMSPAVDKIFFTGSVNTGQKIMKMASPTTKRLLLELGGKSANIILNDADIDLAVEGAVYGAFLHQGQMCSSGSRVLVSSKRYDEFLDKMKKRVQQLRVGYQLNSATHIGPLISKEHLQKISDYVVVGKKEGGTLVVGGEKIEVPDYPGGYYFSPTVFATSHSKSRIAQEEIFGPVSVIIKYESEEEAISIANDSKYGLAGGVFSRDKGRALSLAKKIQTGTVWINNYHLMNNFCPFGGYKQSGVGRELGEIGLSEYTEVKRIHISDHNDNFSRVDMKILTDDKRIPEVDFRVEINVVAGSGAIRSVYDEVNKIKCNRVLIIAAKDLKETGYVELLKKMLSHLCVGVFDEVIKADMGTVDVVSKMGRELAVDCIVSMGGGSVIDLAKAVCVTLKNGGTIRDHIAIGKLFERQVLHIAIPTTTGTGSEATCFAAITDEKIGLKKIIADKYIAPNTAILDPDLTKTLAPKMLVASTMDALTHSIESLTSVKANQISDGFALRALVLINKNLPLIESEDGDTARFNLQLAGNLAGQAINIAGVGLAHAMAHAVEAHSQAHHGAICGVLLTKIMKYNIKYCAHKFELAAGEMGLDLAESGEVSVAHLFISKIEELISRSGHPERLRDLGVLSSELLNCAFDVIHDDSIQHNPRPVNSLLDILEIYKLTF